jgi:hypothetical protein
MRFLKIDWFSALVVTSLMLGLVPATPSNSQELRRYFSETQHYVKGRFLDYWMSHGALAQQGFPLSEEINEMSDVDGKIYNVQYFERAVFEYHPENKPPNDVLLSLLGSLLYRQKYPSNAANQVPNTLAGSVLFSQTGKRVGGSFLSYWQKNGGLAQQGYPISDEFLETSDLDGRTYKVQYFERAVFEEHPEYQPPNNVLLSQLGRFRLTAKYRDGASLPKATPPKPDGLGLTRQEWQAKYGKPDPAPPELCYVCIYQGQTLEVVYDRDSDRIMYLHRMYPQAQTLDYARIESLSLIPQDAQLRTQKRYADLVEDSTRVVDVYYSKWLADFGPLSSVDPPGFLSVVFTELYSQDSQVHSYEIDAWQYSNSSPVANSASGHGPGGLGLARSTWERVHGPGESSSTPGERLYEDFRYWATYSSDGNIIDLTVKSWSEPSGEEVAMAYARRVSKRLIPSDAQLMSQKQLELGQVTSYDPNDIFYVDTYWSKSLSTTYKPGTVSWGGSKPGTFNILFSGKKSPIYRISWTTVKLGEFKPEN